MCLGQTFEMQDFNTQVNHNFAPDSITLFFIHIGKK